MRVHLTYQAIIIILILGLIFLYRGLQTQKQQSVAKDSIIAEKNAEITYHKNAYGTIYAEKNAAIADLKALQSSYPDLVKQAVAKLNIKAKDISTLTQTVFHASSEGMIRVMHDTIPGPTVEVPMGDIKDGYLELHGELVEDVFDYVKYKYTYSDTLIQAFELKRRLFAADVAVIKSSLSNPNAKITSETGLMVQKIKHQRLNVSVGVGYNPFQNQFFPTVSAGYALFQF